MPVLPEIGEGGGGVIRCSFCGRNFHIDSLRSFRPDCANGDPRPAITGGRVYACAPCLHRRERFIKHLEANRRNYIRLKAVA